MPDHDDENHPLTSSKKFSSIRFRRLSISSKRRSELKAAISGPHVSYGAGTPTVSLGDAPLRVLNNTRLPHPSSAFVLTNGPSPPQSTLARSLRRNSDVPLGQHRSNLAWPTNHPEITPAYGPPHPPHRATHRKPHKADISRPLAPDSSRFSSAPVMSRKTSRRSAQIIRRPHLSGSIASGLFIGNTDEVAPQPLSLSDQQSPVSNLLGSPSDQFDPRTIVDSYPALDLDLDTGAASFGSVKQRTRKIDKALRTSRTVLLPAPRESVKPDLVYTDDSDALPSPPSTPSTPVWETATPPIPKLDPKLATQLDLADVHAQIQAMLDSVSRPPSTGSGDFEPANDYQTDVPPSPRPSNPMYRSLPRLATAHRRCASSPPLGSDIHNAYPPDFMGRLLYQPVAPVVRKNLISPTSPLPEVTPADQTSTPATPTKKSVSERSDSPSVYSQQSPSSQSDNITPTSSNASSPDHPHAKSKHERLLAAISEGISSPTKLGTTAPSVLGSGRRRDDKPDSALHTDVPTVPVIVVTDPNDDDLVYSESSFSIVDMYAGPVESVEARQRRRTRTANFYQPRSALESPTLRESVSFNSPRRSQLVWECSSLSNETQKGRVSIFRPGLPSSFLSMSTLHDVEIAEATSTPRDRKSFYAAVGLKGLFRRSSSKGSLAQAQGNSTADAGGGRARPGSTSSAATGSEGGDDGSKGGWGLFRWKR